MLAVSTLVTSVPAGVFASEPVMTVKEESSTSGAEENLADFFENAILSFAFVWIFYLSYAMMMPGSKGLLPQR